MCHEEHSRIPILSIEVIYLHVMREKTYSVGPLLLSPKDSGDRRRLKRLSTDKGVFVVNKFQQQRKELFLCRNPRLKLDPNRAQQEAYKFLMSQKGKEAFDKQGVWVYYDWLKTLVHILPRREYEELRTARNRNLITRKEQHAFKNFKIGIIGLSVGNSVALCIALEGAERLRLADHDSIDLSNLNRIRGGLHGLGTNKAIFTARQIYELNPYAVVDVWANGIEEKKLRRFLKSIDIVVDEMDDVVLKLRLREEARKLRIPVVSAADNGDNAIVDVERFDKEPRREIYHGLLGEINIDNVKKATFREKFDLINKMVGIEYVTSRMKQSLLLVGKEIYAWPQLGGAAFLSGAALTYAIRKIAIGEKMPSGKYDVSLDRVFNPLYDSAPARRSRLKESQRFISEFRKNISKNK